MNLEDIKKESEDYEVLLKLKEIKYCPNCNERLIKKERKFFCNKCDYEELTTKELIKETLETYGNLTAKELSQILNISTREVYAYLNNSTIEITSPSKFYIKCKICGTNIVNGAVCPKCYKDNKRDLMNSFVQMGDTINTPKKIVYDDSKTGKFHFKRKRK